MASSTPTSATTTKLDPSQSSLSPTIESCTPSFTTLPPELRDHIFSFLTPRLEYGSDDDYQISHRLCKRIGVGHISHIPPPLSLLLTNKQCHHESLDTYYRKASFTLDRFIDASYPWPIYGIEDIFGKHNVLGRIRKLDVFMWWSWLPSKHLVVEVEGGESITGREIEVRSRVERMQRAVNVLAGAENLASLTLTWKEVAFLRVEGQEEDDTWELEARKRALEPLRDLKGVRISAADVVAGKDVEESLTQALTEINENTETAGEDQRKERMNCVQTDCGRENLDGVWLGDGQYLLTPEEREIHRRKPSYFD